MWFFYTKSCFFSLLWENEQVIYARDGCLEILKDAKTNEHQDECIQMEGYSHLNDSYNFCFVTNVDSKYLFIFWYIGLQSQVF